MKIVGTATSNNSILEFITVLIIFVFVLGITYFTTKWVANFQKTQNKGKNLEIIEIMRISNNKNIQIVKIGTEYVAIAVCKDSVTLLNKMSEEELKLTKETSVGGVDSFQQMFEKFKNKTKKNK